ncbi:MAG: hypothetical protein KAH08_00670 [Methylococcales bacterium]|nr:hypothetical protein [Methylococcales bacterium]
MKKANKNKSLLIIMGLTFIVILLVYIVNFNFLVNKDIKISHSYKHFLLEYTNSPRLIIESGSNSFYGINSTMLEKELGLLTINLADNGGYPLSHKLLRIEKYAGKGDIVLLPLEWQHYSYGDIPSNYLDSLFEPLNYYYNSLPWIEKIKIIVNVPFLNWLKMYTDGKAFSSKTFTAQSQIEYKMLMTYEQRFKNLERGDAVSIDTTIFNRNRCNNFIFPYQDEDGFYISNKFKKNVKLIHKLQKKGIKVFFTWPSVAGNNCYEGKEKEAFKKFVEKIKTYLVKNKLTIISEPELSKFGDQYIYSINYHIIPKARDIRTKNLIQEIKQSKIFKWFNISSNPPYKLNINSSTLKENILESLTKVRNGEVLKLGNEFLNKNVFLMKGWFFHDGKRLWSQGNSSFILINLDETLVGKALSMKMESYHYKKVDQSKTTIIINGKTITKAILNGKNNILIPKELTKSGVLKIELHYSDVKSPSDYGDDKNDHRKFKLWIVSLMFLTTKE